MRPRVWTLVSVAGLLSGCDVEQTVIVNQTSAPVQIVTSGREPTCRSHGGLPAGTKLFLDCDPQTLRISITGSATGSCNLDGPHTKRLGTTYLDDDSAFFASKQSTQRAFILAPHVCRLAASA
jgi:hypothetical protein